MYSDNGGSRVCQPGTIQFWTQSEMISWNNVLGNNSARMDASIRHNHLWHGAGIAYASQAAGSQFKIWRGVPS